MIIDASVALRWFLNEPGAADAAAAFAQGPPPIAPDLVIVEIGNGLWAATQKQRISAATARAQLAAAPHLFGELRLSEALAPKAFEIGCTLGHPIYDCLYLAMAEGERMPLLTADARLQKAVTGTPWGHLVSVLTA